MGCCRNIILKMARKKKKKKRRATKIEIILTSIATAVFLFFVLPFFMFTALWIPKLHFCSYSLNFFFSLIWLCFGIIGLYFLCSYKKMNKVLAVIYLVVLIIGILFINVILCLPDGSYTSTFSETTELFEPIPDEPIPVPYPPCRETDSGRDYISFGMILSGADIADMCLNGDILRERYCDSELTYTSEDISCSDYSPGYSCVSNECTLTDIGDDGGGYIDADGDGYYVDDDNPDRSDCDDTNPDVNPGETEICDDDLDNDCDGIFDNSDCSGGSGDAEEELVPETDCGDGLDNDGDTFIDCEDTDCQIPFEEGGCGEFEYSCDHRSPYPECGGTCPTGEECIIYNAGDGTLDGGWCSCMPEEETACYGSVGCSGWCGEDYNCIGDSFGCYCEFDTAGDCTDTDGGIDIYEGGFCLDYLDNNYIEYCGWEKGDENTLYEYYCLYGEATDLPTDCAALGLICIEPYPEPAYCGDPIY